MGTPSTRRVPSGLRPNALAGSRCQFMIPEGPTAFVFPGQGAQCTTMLEPFRHVSGFAEQYDRVCVLLGRDPLVAAIHNPEFMNRNVVSSLLTVLASVLCLELIRETAPSLRPVAVAGYSVGQWTALYAAGALSAESLFSVVSARARLMDECVDAAEPSGMLAVIGLRTSDVLAICEEAARHGELAQIANDNAPGHYTLSGLEKSLRFVEARLVELRPKRLHRVPVSGAWHSALLQDAVPKLGQFLSGVAIHRPQIRVIDNTTGRWLPDDEGSLRAALSRQVASPVLWRQGIETLGASGVGNLVEIGYGDLLTRYGFFINRSLRHVAAAPPRRVRS